MLHQLLIVLIIFFLNKNLVCQVLNIHNDAKSVEFKNSDVI